MSRHHAHRADSLIEVSCRDRVPAQFLWRGRLYRVGSVFEHWRTSGAWWDTQVVTGVGAAAGQLPDEERQFWRVEAGRGASSGSGVYDLCFDPAADVARGQWSLSCVLD